MDAWQRTEQNELARRQARRWRWLLSGVYCWCLDHRLPLPRRLARQVKAVNGYMYVWAALNPTAGPLTLSQILGRRPLHPERRSRATRAPRASRAR